MKNFIEITRKDSMEKELIRIDKIVSIFKDNIMTSGICDNGYTQYAYIIPCKQSYEEIKALIEESEK